MLKSFKNNKSTKRVENAKKQKAIAVAKKQLLSPPSSDSESDSDSEYEEILISSLNGKPQKKQVVQEPDGTGKFSEPGDEPASHANHFTEPVEEPLAKPSAPIPIPPRKKAQSKKS